MLGAFGLFAFVYPFGIIFLVLDSIPFGMDWMGSLLLALLGIAAGAWLVVNFGTWGMLGALGVYAAGMLLEGIGVMTGALFGRYAYTDVLIPRMPAGVPIAIGFAWIMVVVSGLVTARWLVGSRWGRGFGYMLPLAAIGALLSMGLDLLLEPVAFHVAGYWVWAPTVENWYGVPWTNFLTWLVAVFVLNLLLLYRINLWGRLRWPWVPIALYAMIVLMFGIVNAAHGFWLAALVGLVLLVPVAWRLLPLIKLGAAIGKRAI
jgi:bisanhydrobacterioruberin hydratase